MVIYDNEYDTLPKSLRVKYLGKCSICSWNAVAHGNESYLIDSTYGAYHYASELLVLLICVECRRDRMKAIEYGGMYGQFIYGDQILCGQEELDALRY